VELSEAFTPTRTQCGSLWTNPSPLFGGTTKEGRRSGPLHFSRGSPSSLYLGGTGPQFLLPGRKARVSTTTYPLEAVNDAIEDLRAGRLRGRGTLVPIEV
jgi:hypothetical protein